MALPAMPGPLPPITIATLPSVIIYFALMLEKQDYADNVGPILSADEQTYDFIVVGGGSAGSVIANRLSAPPMNYRVLLLEAGGNPNFITTIPMTTIFLLHNPNLDWMYETVPQKDICLALNGQKSFVATGKGLGGSSSTNFMVYMRGNPAGFDEWAKLTDDPSWSYKEILPYFMKSENYHGNYPNPEVHGTEGPQYIGQSSYHPMADVLYEAVQELGHPIQDLNVKQTDGWMAADTAIKTGTRFSSYSAFIEPILNRKNLVVSRYSKVTKFIFDRENPKKVIGVEYFRHNSSIPKNAYASKEVISSAGTINSPRLLLLSGIGPATELKALEIPVVQDNSNVGGNLLDHPMTGVFFVFNKTDVSFIAERDLTSAMNDYTTKQSGPAATSNAYAMGYTSSPLNKNPNWPDVQMTATFLGMSEAMAMGMSLFNVKDGVAQKYFGQYAKDQTDGNLCLITQVRPRSKGAVRLASKDPNVAPLIDPKYFSDPEGFDMQSMVHGMKYLVNLYENTKAYKKLNAKFLPNSFPGCESHVFKSDEYYECYIRQFSLSLWHYSGTCRMGKADDPKAVVDPQLKVFGIEGLRVADASVMPVITNGNTNAPTMMIAEKAADMILKEWANKPSSAHDKNNIL